MANASSTELPSHRACAHCRSQKVRCLPDESNPDICQRCAKSSRLCVYTPVLKRRQRKRTDTRVAELEREMSTMRALLKSKQDGTKHLPRETVVPLGKPEGLRSHGTDSPEEMRSPEEASAEQPGPTNSSSKETNPAPKAQDAAAPRTTWSREKQPQDGGDVVDRGLLSMATARQLFETYRSDLCRHYPMVPVPASTSAEEMRARQPTLFLAIIAAASVKENSDLSAVLDKEVLQTYATKSLVQSEKSLELVQALLISSVWYYPPSRFGQLKYYEYIHMAATMAMNIGIGTRPLQHRSRRRNAKRGREPASLALIHPAEDVSNPDLSMAPRSRSNSPDTGSTESRRTLLACYAVCTGVSLSLRRPSMLRATSYVRDCVEHLNQAPDALESDRFVVAWVKLTMIAEEIGVSFSFDDLGGIPSLAELRTQMMLKDLENRLSSWYTSTPEADMNPSAKIMYYTMRLHLYEIALHVDHCPEDFRAPYQMGTIHPFEHEEAPTKILADAISECISSSYALIDTFLSIEPDSSRALPVFCYVRTSFAAFVLAKLCASAAHPNSRIGKVVGNISPKAVSYLERAILHVRNVVGPYRTRVPAVFLALLFKLRQWCLEPLMIEQSANSECRPRQAQRIPPAITQVTMEIDGPRVTEHFSSNDSSPSGEEETMHGDIWHSEATDSASQTVTDLTPDIPISYNNDRINAGGAGAESTIKTISIPQVENFNDAGFDQMQMDYSFLNSLGDTGEYPEGGLTGLDDWMPNDVVGLEQVSSVINWHSFHGTEGPT